MSDLLDKLLFNLKISYFNNESITIGGGEFNPSELAAIVKEIKQLTEEKK